VKLCLPSKLPPAEGLRAVLLSLARKANVDILHIAEAPEDRIHELRTGMKKYRALLRLASDVLPKRQRKAILEQVRAIKDAVAASRDDLVIFKTVQKGLGDEAVRKLGLKNPHEGEPVILSDSLRATGRELVRITAKLDFDGLESDGLCRRWKRNVRHAHKAMKTAAKSDDATDFHEWRKAMKDLWYQSDCLRHLTPKIDAFRKPAEHLSDTLGAEHDLTIVLGSVKDLEEHEQKHLENERHRLRKEAIKLGEELE
jgi:CHAD domain-containing protein